MGAETDLSPPSLEPTASQEPETLRNDDRDWMFALRESVSFGRFLSEPLEWDTTATTLPAPAATIGHFQSPPATALDLELQVNFSAPAAEVGAQSASSNCGVACIGGSGPGLSCSPCLLAARSSGNATHIGGAQLHLDNTIAYLSDSLRRQMFQSMMCMLATSWKHHSDVEYVGSKYGFTLKEQGQTAR